MPESHVDTPSPTRTNYWRRNRSLILCLLGCWAMLTFIPAFFARSLPFSVFGWPFSFWMAAYGAPLSYLILIAIYAWLMNRADERFEQRGD